ncbi:MAG: ABC transporter permease [Lachnospiraceae bacterium]
MMGLLVLKERLKVFYGKYDIYINPLFHFAFGFSAVLILNTNLGFMTRLASPVTAFVMGLVCSFLPYSVISLLIAVLMLIHLFSASMEIALVVGVLVFIIILLYCGLQPGNSYLLVLTPMMFFLKIPYVLPILVGLTGSISAVIPVSLGVFMYYILVYINQNVGALTGTAAAADITQKYLQLIKSMLSNQTAVVMIAAFALCIMVVYMIKRLSVDYAWYLAIAAGLIVQLAVIFMGDILFSITVPMGTMVIGMLLSALVALIYTFFAFAVDYSRTEYLQYEDDDYYYYVKAVPKIAVTAPDVKVQKINSRKKRME